MIKLKSIFKNSRGQTSTEYILMLTVVVTLMITLSRKVNLLVMDESDCDNNQTLICKFKKVMMSELVDQGAPFRFFTLRH